ASALQVHSITISPREKTRVSGTNSVLYQLSGSTDVSVSATPVGGAGGGLLIAAGMMVELKPIGGASSTLLQFLLSRLPIWISPPPLALARLSSGFWAARRYSASRTTASRSFKAAHRVHGRHNKIWEHAERLSTAGQNPDDLPVDRIAAELTNRF